MLKLMWILLRNLISVGLSFKVIFFFLHLHIILLTCHIVSSYWLLPALVLKRMVIGNFERGSHDSEKSDAIDFVVDCVSEFSSHFWI